MKNNKLFAIIIAMLFVSFVKAGDKQNVKIYEMTNRQIDSLIEKISGQNLTITERINIFSSMFLGMPYNLTCTGDGPYALLENEPLVNFKNTNCMVYCEHVLALSISDSWDNFFNNLQQIRYKDGIIGMRTRNHYTMADWLPENSWLLHDVTQEIGGRKALPVTRTISHKTFFEGKGIDDLRYVKPDRKLTRFYVPFSDLFASESRIHSGDILSLIFAGKDNIFSAHMLMAIRKHDGLYIRESAMSKMTTFDTPFAEWVDKYLNSTRYLGLAFMRVNDELNTKGRIILPWNIPDLKKKFKFEEIKTSSKLPN